MFETQRGWCEQVASTLVVMLRSVGVPARVATGFVTGKRDPLTGRYVVRERDAHAWAEVYFPGVGWQGFDPTASVPLAGEAAHAKSWFEQARDAVAARRRARAAAGGRLGVRDRRGGAAAGRSRAPRRTPSWAATMFARLERLGRATDVDRRPAQTVREYAGALAQRALGDPALAHRRRVHRRRRVLAARRRPGARSAAELALTRRADVARRGERASGAGAAAWYLRSRGPAP